MDVDGEVNFCENSKKNFLRGVGWGGSKVWVRRVMWGMGDVNQE